MGVKAPTFNSHNSGPQVDIDTVSMPFFTGPQSQMHNVHKGAPEVGDTDNVPRSQNF